jgi:hypothetical protein
VVRDASCGTSLDLDIMRLASTSYQKPLSVRLWCSQTWMCDVLTREGFPIPMKHLMSSLPSVSSTTFPPKLSRGHSVKHCASSVQAALSCFLSGRQPPKSAHRPSSRLPSARGVRRNLGS